MENANLMAAVYMGKVWPKKKFPLIGLHTYIHTYILYLRSFGQVTEHIISLTSKVQQSEI